MCSASATKCVAAQRTCIKVFIQYLQASSHSFCVLLPLTSSQVNQIQNRRFHIPDTMFHSLVWNGGNNKSADRNSTTVCLINEISTGIRQQTFDSMLTVKTAWLRELSLFIEVAATVRWAHPLDSTWLQANKAYHNQHPCKRRCQEQRSLYSGNQSKLGNLGWISSHKLTSYASVAFPTVCSVKPSTKVPRLMSSLSIRGTAAVSSRSKTCSLYISKKEHLQRKETFSPCCKCKSETHLAC